MVPSFSCGPDQGPRKPWESWGREPCWCWAEVGVREVRHECLCFLDDEHLTMNSRKLRDAEPKSRAKVPETHPG